MRKIIVAGNWKMNKLVSDAEELAVGIKKALEGFSGVDVVLCPPFTALKTVSDAVKGSQVKVGAQNMYWEKSGAYTGEISPDMLCDLGCEYVILGHSERRAYFGETDETVNKKLKAALAAGLKPIVCVGETLEQRDAGDMRNVVETQVRGSLAGLSADEFGKTIVAYEPVWAIGTGRTATPDQAQEVHAIIRSLIKEMANDDVAEAFRIQYGGSVKPANAKELFSQPDIDGGLIGGASLKPDSFVDIVKAGV